MTTKTHLVAAAWLAVFCPLAPAQDPDLLPADTTFVAHVDVARLLDLIGVEALLRHAGDDAREVTDALERVERQWGFDFLRDIRSVTVFGSELMDRAPQVMLVTTARLDGVIDALRDDRGLRSVRSSGLEFHRLDPAGLVRALGIEDAEVEGDADGPVIYVQRLDDDRRAVLIGERAESVAGAARVLAGEAPSLGRDARLGLRATQGSIAYVEVATDFEGLMERTPASTIAGKVRRVAAELSEDDGALTLELAADTDSARDARDVAAVIDGLRGLVSLAGAAAEDIPELARDVIASARAQARDERVTLRLSASLRELRELVEREIGERRNHGDDDDGDDDDRRRERRRQIR